MLIIIILAAILAVFLIFLFRSRLAGLLSAKTSYKFSDDTVDPYSSMAILSR